MKSISSSIGNLYTYSYIHKHIQYIYGQNKKDSVNMSDTYTHQQFLYYYFWALNLDIYVIIVKIIII